MRILITGGNGFLGRNIIQILKDSHDILTLGRSVDNDFISDLAYPIDLKLPKFDLIIHAAGKAHSIPKNKKEEAEFFEVNSKGTQNLLKTVASSGCFPNTLVMISSVSVYGLDSGHSISEIHPLNGASPYALSKISAENFSREWGIEHGVNVVILRLPLVIGHNAPGNFGAMVKAIEKGYYFRLANMENRKSMVLAEDVASLMPQLLNKNGTYNLTDGVNPLFTELDAYLASQLGKRIWTFPVSVLKLFSKIGDVVPIFPLSTYRLEKLSSSLTFDHQKAIKELGWEPRPVIGTFRIKE
ncbi:NAD-dependent epimerase/dehydratase family protein [Algoriphagus sp. NG3]|uniref:NAD-dependent epimerase/dehydratase family protein n=1 Tax=Algoriphagus sp. NG3 TaxID=3097546 RepID=UPI002A83ECF9|nr:NAD-dependent epimerase/dehydratase family protein [Algoriphagus sp. NG3]WPR77794.1 NAD-dependent epimerase/dehydratase family protein [Algoriphagus sp. NG3]